ncbi:MAG: NAD(P)/FAD-dependent oxidoreductase [Mycobacterium sp.]|nr:NAD(P)/FAD-dependent oxidoreductase [Mycobacterium sp.]
MTDITPIHVTTAIIGAGFGGIGAAIRLKKTGDHDFLVFERATEVGGTWQANTYPGAQCDIPSVLYSFSFAPNPNWTRLYPLQSELKAYIERCATEAELWPHIRLSHDVTAAQWDDAAQLWRITAAGNSFTATFLIAATGPFSEPSIPDLPGLEQFTGPVFHSAQWRHDVDLRGRAVGVIGTGASAVQFVPQLQPEAAKLVLFQRTPTWILPHPDRPVSPAIRALFSKLPSVQRTLRAMVSLLQEAMVPGLVYNPALLRPMEAFGRWHLRRQIADADQRAKLTPQYAFGCKRPTFSNTYYPALAAPNAEVETQGIRRVTATGIETVRGTHHRLNAIVFGTGFKLAHNEGFTRIRGRDGKTLAEAWEGGEMKAHLGTAVAGFPNLFMILGPNSVVYTSQVVTIESQLDFILSAIGQARRNGIRSIEVSAQAQQAFTDTVDRRLATSVWNTGGCSSYYLSPSGRNFTFWPGFVFTFARRMHRADLDEFDVRFGSALPASSDCSESVMGR